MSTGISSQVSSGGASGVKSIAPGPSPDVVGTDESSVFSLFGGSSPGGGAEAIVTDYKENHERVRVPALNNTKHHSYMADPSAPSADDRARYEALKKELMQALPRKRAVDKQLVCFPSTMMLFSHRLGQAQIELQIYNLEVSYLTETAAHSGGNIIQGFENYLKNQTAGRRKYEIHDQDRIFSNSSLTLQKV